MKKRENDRRRIPHRWKIAATTAVLLLIAALFYQAYLGRVAIVVQGCVRVAQDRADTAAGLRATIPQDTSNRRLVAVIASLESRTRPTPAGRRAFCQDTSPKPTLVPSWGG